MEYDITSASVCLLMINLVTLFWPPFLTSSEISCWNVSEFDQTNCSAVLPLRMGLIHTAKMYQCLISLYSAYELRPQRKYCATALQTQ